MIIRKGNHPLNISSTNKTAEIEDMPKVALFHIKGTNSLNTRATQVDMKTDSLNSGDSFVLRNLNTLYVWYGRLCNQTERNFALSFIEQLKGSEKINVIEIEEGNEGYEFWRLLGGKMDYASSSNLQNDYFEPRLFLCSNASGTFKVEEITNFSQDDLSKDDVMILDAYDEVFVWVGSGANDLEKTMAMETAVEYVTQAPDKRGSDTPISRITEGEEPFSFTCHFQSWEESKVASSGVRIKKRDKR